MKDESRQDEDAALGYLRTFASTFASSVGSLDLERRCGLGMGSEQFGAVAPRASTRDAQGTRVATDAADGARSQRFVFIFLCWKVFSGRCAWPGRQRFLSSSPSVLRYVLSLVMLRHPRARKRDGGLRFHVRSGDDRDRVTNAMSLILKASESI